jgi:hypothetical protein
MLSAIAILLGEESVVRKTNQNLSQEIFVFLMKICATCGDRFWQMSTYLFCGSSLGRPTTTSLG